MPEKLNVMPGVDYYPDYFSVSQQSLLLADIEHVLQLAPFFTPMMPRTGTPFSVQMSNCGALGWVSDIKGYRYQPTHPVTGERWPDIPPRLLETWQKVADFAPVPEACLINLYSPSARMGLHQDRDEANFDAPVVSVSLGDTAVFRIGGTSRKNPTRSLHLKSGDVLVFGGPARLAFHGIDRILGGTSRLLENTFSSGGRINLTLRRVTPVASL